MAELILILAPLLALVESTLSGKIYIIINFQSAEIGTIKKPPAC